MSSSTIASRIDQTFLDRTTTQDRIRTLIEESLPFGFAAIVVPPCMVKPFAGLIEEGGSVLCTVAGFPLGFETTESKRDEAVRAVEEGAREIDMVINPAWMKAGETQKVLSEIKCVTEAVKNLNKEAPLVKVIVETALLTTEEKITVLGLVEQSGADFIKTSTGFGGLAGAALEDVELFASRRSTDLKIKASGGIRTFEEALRFIEAGAERIGTSSGVTIAGEEAALAE